MEDKVISRINGLLAKAERASTSQESDAYFAKAQELMTKYSIEEIQLKHSDKIEIVHEEIKLGTDKSVHLLYRLVGTANNCYSFSVSHGYYSQTGQWRSKTEHRDFYGTDSDIFSTKVMASSLSLHCARILNLHREIVGGETKGKSFGYNFRIGYAERIYSRLMAARRGMTDTEPGTALALRDKAALAESTARNQNDLTSTALAKTTNHEANYKGRVAADSADISNGHNMLRERLAIES